MWATGAQDVLSFSRPHLMRRIGRTVDHALRSEHPPRRSGPTDLVVCTCEPTPAVGERSRKIAGLALGREALTDSATKVDSGQLVACPHLDTTVGRFAEQRCASAGLSLQRQANRRALARRPIAMEAYPVLAPRSCRLGAVAARAGFGDQPAASSRDAEKTTLVAAPQITVVAMCTLLEHVQVPDATSALAAEPGITEVLVARAVRTFREGRSASAAAPTRIAHGEHARSRSALIVEAAGLADALLAGRR